VPNNLANAISPYLRSHAGNPVDWQQWGPDAFAQAEQRQVPVMVSIGYSTCHWCHVMARESFSDPVVAAYLNDHFVAIKVDREEYPDVDASYLAAAGVFTDNLGWPLNVFVTPAGQAFFAGTYWPPQPVHGAASFRQVLEAVHDAWANRRAEVESNAAAVAGALAARGALTAGVLPAASDFAAAVSQLLRYEDTEFGGFGSSMKFPMMPVLQFLLSAPPAGASVAVALADRTLVAMAGSDLRDPVDGGFFRYATKRDWTDPHYERMLYDNAQLLRAYTILGLRLPERAEFAATVADGIAGYLLDVLRLPGGGFASAQDSESMVDGERVEGGYYRLDAARRAAQSPPALDEKVLAGWNGLAIDALAFAGFVYDRGEWVAAARAAADYLLAHHLMPDGTLARASISGTVSAAAATLEDYGLLAAGLLQLAMVTGEVRYAIAGRDLVDASLAAAPARPESGSAAAPAATLPFGVPGGGDPVLLRQGTALASDPSESAVPSGITAMATAAHRLYSLTAHRPYREAAVRAMERVAPLALQQPSSFGASLALMCAVDSPAEQLVVVSDAVSSRLVAVARRWHRTGGLVTVVTSEQAAAFATAGFELFEGRTAQEGNPTAFLCRAFVCRLPVTDADVLAAELARG
jgi:uncharacterized protein YyaL (SSP411 family)